MMDQLVARFTAQLREALEIGESIDINADKKSPENIYREVVAAYVKNYTIINIKGDIKGKIKELMHFKTPNGPILWT